MLNCRGKTESGAPFGFNAELNKFINNFFLNSNYNIIVENNREILNVFILTICYFLLNFLNFSCAFFSLLSGQTMCRRRRRTESDFIACSGAACRYLHIINVSRFIRRHPFPATVRRARRMHRAQRVPPATTGSTDHLIFAP